jgi:AbrB family looped-hinge helix DNA binding protein
METTVVSPKYQVVIPQKIREQLNIRPGQRMQVLVLGNSVQLVPVRPMSDYRGIARGIDTDVARDEEDRL